MSECTERCEEQFGQCTKHGDMMGGMQCMAHRQYCLNGCAEEHFNDPPAPAPQESTCGQGPCPECGPQYSMSSPCALASGHSDYHSCAYSHSWY